MKKIVLLLTTILMGIGAFAQFQAGNILVNGTLVFGSNQSKSINGGTTTDGPKTTTFEIGPGLEYFFTDKISFGAEIDFSTEKTVDKNPGGPYDETRDKTTLTTISPFAAMYFINEEKFALFCKLGVGFGFGKNVYETITGGTTVSNENKVSSFEIGLKPGVVVHLSEKFGMTATIGELGYRSNKSDNGNTVNKNSSYGLQISPALGFGIFFKLK